MFKKFQSNRSGGKGGKSFGGDRSWDRPSTVSSGQSNRGSRGRDSGRAMLHDATCSMCSKPCQVPFRPTGGRAVYCRDCFKKDEDHGSRNSSFETKRPYHQSAGGDSSAEQLRIINAKLDAILEALDSES